MRKIKDVTEDLEDACDYPIRELEGITNIDIHHSADNNRKGFDAVKFFHRVHIESNNWCGIGYHYVIAKDGTIFKTGEDREKRWSVSGNNSYTISCMLIGDFTEEEPTEEQYSSALFMVNRLRHAYGVPVRRVKGHSEYTGNESKVCPAIDMTRFREELENYE